MNAALRILIEDFVTTTAKRFAQLQRELAVSAPTSRIDWATNAMKKKGTLSDGATFSKHGAGVRIVGKSDTIDFDFGDRGEIDGFDAWRLSEFVRGSPTKHSLSTPREIQGALDSALAAGEIEKRGSLYYLK